MGKPRKTGIVLFDILWDAYPPRLNKLGLWEKKKKGPAIKKFKQEDYSEETVYDMVAWIRKDNEYREKSRKANEFFSPPPDLIVFLNQDRWTDEVGEVATESQRYEKKRSQSIHSNNAQSKIDSWSKVIHERSIEELRNNPQFMAAYKSCPEFRTWVQKELPNRESAKPDHVVEVNKKVPQPLKVETVADLPPPSCKAENRKKLYDELIQYRNKTNPLMKLL
jgi:hypothetical protein